MSNPRRRRCIQLMGAMGFVSLASAEVAAWFSGTGGGLWLATTWWRCIGMKCDQTG
jgi:hypothetical protein